MLTAARCNKDKDPIDQLPPETREGRNTFGCLIDGKAFIAKHAVLNDPNGSYYQAIYPGPNGYVFQARGGRNGSGCEFQQVIINADSVSIREGGTYPIKSCSRGNFCGEYFLGLHTNCSLPTYRYHSSDIETGEIFISKFDQANLIVAGTFWLDMLDSAGTKIEIRQGRFDLKYTR